MIVLSVRQVHKGSFEPQTVTVRSMETGLVVLACTAKQTVLYLH